MRTYGEEKQKRDDTKKQMEMKHLTELSRILYQRQEQRMEERQYEEEQAKLREQRLLKTAARSRALRQSRKNHPVDSGSQDSSGDLGRGSNLLDFARNLETR